MEEQANSATTAQPRRITTSQVADLLNQGKERKEIKEILGLSNNELKVVFSSPSLKGKRTKKSRRTTFILEDDLSANASATATSTAGAPNVGTENFAESVVASEIQTPAPQESATNVATEETSAPSPRRSTAAIPNEAAAAPVEQPVAKQEEAQAVEVIEEVQDDRPAFDI